MAEVKRQPNMTFKAYLNAINQELQKKYNRHHMPACILLTQDNKPLPFLEFNFLDKKFTMALDGLKVTPYGSLQDDSVKKTRHGKDHYESELSFSFNLVDDELTLTVYYLTDAYDEIYVNQFVKQFIENFQSVLLYPDATVEAILNDKNQNSGDLEQQSGYNTHQQQAKNKSALLNKQQWGNLFKTASDHLYTTAATVVAASAVCVVASQLLKRI